MIKKDRLVKTLIDLIKIDSPSGEEKALAEELKNRFEQLGGNVEFDKVGNLIARFNGEGEPIILSAHMDTVEPGRNIEPIVEVDLITSKGETILGSDPKAGIAAILEAITAVKESGGAHIPLEVVLTIEEETGSKGAKGLDCSKLSAKRAVVFDGDAEVFNVNTAAPGYYAFDVVIVGRAAHAGLEPEKGISSIKIAADFINKLTLGRIDEETTANVGIISGGSARNAVPEKTEVKGEFRSRNKQKLEMQVQDFEKVITEVERAYPEAKIACTLEKHFDSFNIPNDDPFAQEIGRTMADMDLTAKFEPTGGGSDANFYNANGIKAVVVGTGVRDLHTTKESLTISEMVQAAGFCEKLITVI